MRILSTFRSSRSPSFVAAAFRLLLMLTIAASGLSTFAADPATNPAVSTGKAAPVVVATVDGKPIYAADIDRTALAATAVVPSSEVANPVVRAALLNQLINQLLVDRYLELAKVGPSKQDIDLEIERLKAELGRSGQTLEKFLARNGQTEAALRTQLERQLGAQKFLKQAMTDEALEAYFKAHQRDFDGTQLRVSHILFRPTSAGDDASTAVLVRQAEKVRRKILEGSITFAAAAEQYSAGPSRRQGGEMAGLISRHGPMVEPFSRPHSPWRKVRSANRFRPCSAST